MYYQKALLLSCLLTTKLPFFKFHNTNPEIQKVNTGYKQVINASLKDFIFAKIKSYFLNQDRVERHDFWPWIWLFFSHFLFSSKIREKEKRRVVRKNRDQKSCLSARSKAGMTNSISTYLRINSLPKQQKFITLYK